VPPPWGIVALSSLVPGLGQYVLGFRWEAILWLLLLPAVQVFVVWVLVSPSFPGLVPVIVGVISVSALVILMLLRAYHLAPQPPDRQVNRPWLAAWLSILVPGLGQFYSGRFFAGLGFIIVVPVSWQLPGWWSLASRVLEAWAIFHAWQSGNRRFKGDGRWARPLLISVVAGGVCGATLDSLLDDGFTGRKMPSSSMAPTILGAIREGQEPGAGDRVVVDKLTYRFREPRRGEIVMFVTAEITDLPESLRGREHIKRVVGLPGERVRIQPPRLFINGRPCMVPTVLARIQEGQDGYTGYTLPATVPAPKYLATPSDELQLGPEEYFVLGDNSDHSFDSRYFGPIRRKAIVGRVTKIYWPWSRRNITFAEE
jgi:signal peptidase I